MGTGEMICAEVRLLNGFGNEPPLELNLLSLLSFKLHYITLFNRIRTIFM